MSQQFSLTRRDALLLGMGSITAIAASLGEKVGARNGLFQAFNTLDRNFTAVGEQSLVKRAKAKGLTYGAAIDHSVLSADSEFVARFLQECGLLVTENGLLWPQVHPEPNRFDFKLGDGLAEFAKTHNLPFRANHLVWHQWLPEWVRETVNPQNAEKVLVDHIQTVAGRYAGQMHSWDVVNEAIEPLEEREDGLRVETPWLELLGPDYIELAFQAAAAADPQALLVYNDYGLEYDNPTHEARRTAVLKLLERLVAKGTPIHALGIQSHLSGSAADFNPEIFQKFLRDVANLGLEILVTELDVSDRDLPFDLPTRDRAVASAYEDYLSVVLDEPAIATVVTWGLSDRYTWLSWFEPREDKAAARPLPLDDRLNRKLSWHAIARAFDHCSARSM
jgi:endo-1,4-beta-xylanase